MFKDKGEQQPSILDYVQPHTPWEGTVGKKCRLIANCFRINMSPNGSISHYRYKIQPPVKDAAEDKLTIQQIWSQLRKHLGTFVVQCPCHIFSPSELAEDLTLTAPADPRLGYEAHEVSVTFYQNYSAEQVNDGIMGEAEVVAQHIVKRLVEPLMYQRVGRRYFNNCDAMEGKAQLTIFSGFYAALNRMSLRPNNGPQLQVDMMYRALHKRNIIESLQGSLGSDPVALTDPEVMSEWRRRCLFSTVVTLYNNRVYRIKAIHFDKSPRDQFPMYQRDEKVWKEFSFVQYYQAYYNREISELRQPLLEAFPEKDSEQVFLVPELCALTGFNDEMRKDKNLMAEALKQTKVSPQERMNAILNLTSDMARNAFCGERVAASSCQKLMQDWKVSLDKQPLEVDARIFDPLEVSFGAKKYLIEEGNFQRWMRNGLQCPTRLDDWLFIYPESDVPVLDIWLRSLRDIAQVAFTMKMADPNRIVCSDQRQEIVGVLESKLTPKTQMVLLLTPQKDSKKVYQLFKQTTCTRFPCVTQVVKSETIRKRQSIAAVLSRIVLQINAKFCGPLWHIELESQLTKPLFSFPTMVVGIDVYHSCDKEQYFGFAASLDTQCTEYFSMASALDPARLRQSLSVKLQECFRDAVLHFARRNEGLLPEQVIVYRASVSQEDWPAVKATELEAIKAVLDVAKSSLQGENYEPHLTFIAISKRVGMRFFNPSPNQQNIRNPEPGTVIDIPVTNRSDYNSFYLINQAVGKGTATPTHYTVLYDSAKLSPNVLQNLSYRLSFLYFNYTGSVKMPAPAQYAKKIAHLIGTAVRADPHKRLLRTFFYL